ncbi:MAG: type IV toxin-antitoxin system AbiEi family antitoxin domain-containing protein [Prevotellaceae bacterium]|jgi:predicted transcriptional regulator of viral defense system|nr:type IV toxin-antitoxin system AbiEi family antitoxin domain-containing protein [Prevotellaceae bacterium]
MDINIEIQILSKIKKAKRGALFFTDNFSTFGNPDALRKALERLVKSGEIDRIAAGIYVRPKMDDIIGKVTPDIEDIAKAIARRDRARIVPTGDYALNRLGLSTQVPMNIVYLTDGTARKIKIGNYTVAFQKTAPKNVSAIGEISRLVIQALRSIGKDNATNEEIKHIQELLQKEKLTHLQHDIKLAPAWIRAIMNPAIKTLEQ